MEIWYLAIVMLLHHVVDGSQHLLGGAKSHWSLWHIAMLVEVNLMPGDGVPSHRSVSYTHLTLPTILRV